MKLYTIIIKIIIKNGFIKYVHILHCTLIYINKYYYIY